MNINFGIIWAILFWLIWNLCHVFFTQCTLILIIPLHNSFPISLIIACISMVLKFNMVSEPFLGYQQTSETSIVHQKQLSFHIIPIIISFLTLDFVQRSLCRHDELLKCAHVEVEGFELTYDCKLNWFCSVLCRYIRSFLKNWLINI